MSQYKRKSSAVVEALQLTDIPTIIAWLYANYSGHWSLESDHDPATIFLAVDTLSGKSHATAGQWTVAEPPLPASRLTVLTDATFQAAYDPVAP